MKRNYSLFYMKKIIITEAQLRKIVESHVFGTAPTFDNGDVKEFNDGTEISTSATIHDEDGNPKYSDPTTTDNVQDVLSIQNYWANGINGKIYR